MTCGRHSGTKPAYASLLAMRSKTKSTIKSTLKSHHSYRAGGHPKQDAPRQQAARSARNKSWTAGQKGHGGEGHSKGYGGSGGRGTGPLVRNANLEHCDGHACQQVQRAKG